jgi:uncharacterized protein involved in type VI secretion and phage assembly
VNNDLIRTLRAIVRDELARQQPVELGVVTRVHESDADDTANHQVNVRMRSSGVELQRVPVTVSRLGLSTLPNEGDVVLLAFVGGDMNAPVAVGCLYDDQSHPPKAKAHEVVYEPPDEEDSSLRRMQITLANGSAVTFGEDQLEVTLGGTSLIVKRDGDVEIKTTANVKFSADGNVDIASSGNLTLEAQGNLTLKGVAATLEATAAAKVKGAQVTVAGMIQFSAA